LWLLLYKGFALKSDVLPGIAVEVGIVALVADVFVLEVVVAASVVNVVVLEVVGVEVGAEVVVVVVVVVNDDDDVMQMVVKYPHGQLRHLFVINNS
jgi:hypothetical protein